MRSWMSKGYKNPNERTLINIYLIPYLKLEYMQPFSTTTMCSSSKWRQTLLLVIKTKFTNVSYRDTALLFGFTKTEYNILQTTLLSTENQMARYRSIALYNYN